MSTFSTQPKAAPDVSQPNNAKVSSSSDARARAIALLSQPKEAPVQEPSKITAEELQVVKPTEEGQTDKVEAPAEPEATKAPAKAPEEPLSNQYAQLARKERALRAKVQEIKAQEAAVKAQADKTAQLEERLAKYEAMEKRMSEDPLSLLNERGITYDEITKRALNAPSPEEQAQRSQFQELKAQIQALTDAQENSKKMFEESQTRQYTDAVNQIRSQAKSLVDSDPNFETVKETGSIEDVVDLIKQTFEKDGILMSVEDAALAVEEHLLEEAIKLTKLKKIQQRLKPAETKAAAPKQENNQQPQKTLTNNLTTTKPLTAKERAILAFQGKLNK